MNIFRLTLDSLRNKGLKKTAASAWKVLEINLSRLADYTFDFRFRTDTRRIVELHDLEIKSENKSRGVRYEPTRARPLRRLLRVLNLPKDSVFVDLGCGKGRILLLACEYGFKRVKGVDFSPQLCEVAKKNLAIYKQKKGLGAEVVIMESDVVDYQLQDDENIFFMFNPFDKVVMERVVGNIAQSLRRNPRQCWLIYYNPVCRNLIEEQRIFVKSGAHFFGGCEFIVYMNKT